MQYHNHKVFVNHESSGQGGKTDGKPSVSLVDPKGFEPSTSAMRAALPAELQAHRVVGLPPISDYQRVR